MRTASLWVVVMALGACGSDADELDESAVAQSVTSYVGFSDETTGGSQGFFIFAPYGTVTTSTVFTGTFANFGTTRLKANVVNINCNTSGPTEGSLVQTLGVTQNGERWQMSRNIGKIGTGLVVGNCYRVKPTLDGFALGFTDFQVTSGTAPPPFRRVTPGSNLTISWRTETALSNDGDSDGVANFHDNCPNDSNANQADSDNDGIGDACDVADNDNDGIADANDNCPTVANSDQADGDGDNIGDVCDVCPADNPNDGDNDGTPSCQEACPTDPLKTSAGQCGCNSADTDTDQDGTADCNDQCPSDPFKTGSGGCGCGAIDLDSNGDGTVDGCTTAANRCGP
jgi:hypothetical protein